MSQARIEINLSYLFRKIDELVAAFPRSSLHTVALKANPLPAVLNQLKTKGIGVEAASISEVKIALRAGISNEKIVFDSPAKTWDELRFAIQNGININANCISELERISEILGGNKPVGFIGVRINPQIGKGGIPSTGTAGNFSKFGVPISGKHRGKLINAFRKWPWLSGVLVHSGSQGLGVNKLVSGIRAMLDFVEEVNEITNNQVTTIDIGGGLSFPYYPNSEKPSFSSYAFELKKECPELFDARFRIVTEFGRSIFAGSGTAIVPVEYIIEEYERKIIIIQIGADLLLRKCYSPDYWHHEIELLDSDENLRKGKFEKYAIAGPLCFDADFVEREIFLPKTYEGDFIRIKDVGAYTFSMWSRYCSRKMPLILGVFEDVNSSVVLKEAESSDDLWNFWI